MSFTGYVQATDGYFYRCEGEDDKKTTWADSRSICASEVNGSRLAILKDERSFDALEKLYPDDGTWYWLGGSSQRSGGSWYWIDAQDRMEEFDFFARRSRPGHGNCLVKIENWRWKAARCIRRQGFCCQLSAEGNAWKNGNTKLTLGDVFLVALTNFLGCEKF